MSDDLFALSAAATAAEDAMRALSVDAPQAEAAHVVTAWQDARHVFHLALRNGYADGSLIPRERVDALESPALRSVLDERAKQDAKWGGPEHDDDLECRLREAEAECERLREVVREARRIVEPGPLDGKPLFSASPRSNYAGLRRALAELDGGPS